MAEGIAQYPFDMENLQRGDLLSKERLIELMPEIVILSDEEYDWKLLQLKDMIERYFLRNRHDGAWVKTHNGGLKILTHIEQSIWVDAQARRHRRALEKCFAYLQHVDMRQLPEETKTDHERRLLVESRYMQAQLQVDKDILASMLRKRRTAEQRVYPQIASPESEATNDDMPLSHDFEEEGLL